MEFRLISSTEAELFQERLNRFIASLGPDVVLGEIKFDTTSMPSGHVNYSALVSFKRVEGWAE
jgi:hypothetical protein